MLKGKNILMRAYLMGKILKQGSKMRMINLHKRKERKEQKFGKIYHLVKLFE